jgi:hypothetical protein
VLDAVGFVDRGTDRLGTRRRGPDRGEHADRDERLAALAQHLIDRRLQRVGDDGRGKFHDPARQPVRGTRLADERGSCRYEQQQWKHREHRGERDGARLVGALMKNVVPGSQHHDPKTRHAVTDLPPPALRSMLQTDGHRFRGLMLDPCARAQGWRNNCRIVPEL